MQRFSFKIIQVGNSLGATFPKEMLTLLQAEKGDTVHVSQAADGLHLSIFDPEVERQVEAGREFMHEFRDTLRALAK